MPSEQGHGRERGVSTTSHRPLRRATQPNAIVGSLLDVSASMKEALEAGQSNKPAIERLRAILHTALKLARAEQRHDPNALMFVGVFGLHPKQPKVVDLCGLIDSLLPEDHGNHQTGHNLLIRLANESKVSHISEYIRSRLSDDEARVVFGYLRRHPERIREFVEVIPPPAVINNMRKRAREGGSAAGAMIGSNLALIGLLGPGAQLPLRIAGFWAGHVGDATAEDFAVEDSEALKLARSIQDEWLKDFVDLVPRNLSTVITLLEKLQNEPNPISESYNRDESVLNTIRKYIYGTTPMRAALKKSQDVFSKRHGVEHRLLVLVSDGMSTDGDPRLLAEELHQDKVSIAAVYLTKDRAAAPRRLYYQHQGVWHEGQHTLFDIASKVDCATHPIPVLASMGWKIPSSGECRLFSTVYSAAMLEDFCSILLSARFGSADTLLDIVGRVHLGSYVNDEHVRACQDPSDQGNSRTCYAHAVAAVIHMALLRILDREGGYPSISNIRKRIIDNFPAGEKGHSTKRVLEAACRWYRPLRFNEVDENGARKAVIRRRPVLTTFHLSKTGWKTFSSHFRNSSTSVSVLAQAHTAPYRSEGTHGGHAVVLSGCGPNSLTFLNSWGKNWGNEGSFSVENSSTLGVDSVPVRFYDVFWVESDLTLREREAYDNRAFEALRTRAEEYPSLFELEARCPHCETNSTIRDFTGTIRRVMCPRTGCRKSFPPKPGSLVQAIYARYGLSSAS